MTESSARATCALPSSGAYDPSPPEWQCVRPWVAAACNRADVEWELAAAKLVDTILYYTILYYTIRYFTIQMWNGSSRPPSSSIPKSRATLTSSRTGSGDRAASAFFVVEAALLARRGQDIYSCLRTHHTWPANTPGQFLAIRECPLPPTATAQMVRDGGLSEETTVFTQCSHSGRLTHR